MKIKFQLLTKCWIVMLVSLLFLASIPQQQTIVVASGNDFAGGDGTSGNPYKIATPEQLNNVRNNLNAHYELITNIDLSSFNNWEPIGNVGFFRGTFNGNGFTISNLKINASNKDNVGLFGYSDVTSIIQNVRLINTDIVGQNYVGGISGYNRGIIKSVLVTGKVQGYSTIGGVAGQNDHGAIDAARSEVNVESAFNTVGGLVGHNYNGTIKNSFANGKVTGNNSVGGLMGSTGYGYIVDSYATGNVQGSKEVGGLIGGIVFGQIIHSYATGNVQGSRDVGGLVGNNTGGSILNSLALNLNLSSTDDSRLGRIVGFSYALNTVNDNYALETMLLNNNSRDSQDATSIDGKNINAVDAKKAQTYTNLGWDFENVWKINEGSSYPTLRLIVDLAVKANVSAGGTVKGNGTYESNSTVKLEATPNNGYKFVNWTRGNQVVSTNPTFNYTVPEIGTTIVANFEKKTYTLTVEPNNSNRGTVTGSGTYQYESTVTIKATPKAGYKFVNWTKDSQVISTNATYTYTIPAENTTIKANFEKENYNLTVEANDPNRGTVIGSGTYQYESTVTIKATPKTGYKFVNWTKDGQVISTNATYTYTIPAGSSTIKANFEKEKYNLTVEANYPNRGTVTGGGTYDYDSSVTVQATPSKGYQFVNWTKSGQVISTNVTYTYTIPAGNTTLKANFEKAQNIVTVEVNDTKGGTASLDGTNEIENDVTLEAIANAGYKFVNWTIAGQEIGTDATFTYTIPAENQITVVANFEKETYELIVEANDPNQGTVTGSGNYLYDSTVTIEATPNKGYKFVNWTKDGQVISTDSQFDYTIPAGNTTIKANFEKAQNIVTVEVNDTNGGTASLDGTNEIENDVTLQATANVGYKFVNWTVEGVEISTEETFTYTIPVEDMVTVVANFEKKNYELTVEPNDPNRGTITGSGTYQYDSTVTIEATPKAGYKFVNWTENGQVISTNATYTYTIPAENSTIKANFEKENYDLTVEATKGGTVTGGGTYEFESPVTIQATPGKGYQFVNWTKDGKVISTNPTYTYTIPANNTTIKANFEKSKDVLTVQANDTNGGTISIKGKNEIESTVTLKATTNKGYQFVNWTVEGKEISQNPSFKYTIPAEDQVTMMANFEKINYQLKVKVNDGKGGKVTGSGTYGYDSPVIVQGTPNKGYRFVNWTVDGKQVSKNPSFTYTMPNKNVTMVANFEKITVNVKAETNNRKAGQVIGSGTYSYGSEVTLKAIPERGYQFVNWTKGDKVLSKEVEYIYAVHENVMIVGNFEKIVPSVDHSKATNVNNNDKTKEKDDTPLNEDKATKEKGTPSNEDQAGKDKDTPSNEDQAGKDKDTPSNEDQVEKDRDTPSNEDQVEKDKDTPSNEDKVTKEKDTSSNEDKVTKEKDTSFNEDKTTIENKSKEDNKETEKPAKNESNYILWGFIGFIFILIGGAIVFALKKRKV